MANAPKLSNAAANTAASAVVALLDGGKLRIYDGSKPADADTAITTQTLLAELTFANPAEASVTGGVVTFDTITADASANATGTASWFRAVKSDGTTVVLDGTVDTAGADCNLNSTAIVAGATVTATLATYTQSKG